MIPDSENLIFDNTSFEFRIVIVLCDVTSYMFTCFERSKSDVNLFLKNDRK